MRRNTRNQFFRRQPRAMLVFDMSASRATVLSFPTRIKARGEKVCVFNPRDQQMGKRVQKMVARLEARAISPWAAKAALASPA